MNMFVYVSGSEFSLFYSYISLSRYTLSPLLLNFAAGFLEPASIWLIKNNSAGSVIGFSF